MDRVIPKGYVGVVFIPAKRGGFRHELIKLGTDDDDTGLRSIYKLLGDCRSFTEVGGRVVEGNRQIYVLVDEEGENSGKMVNENLSRITRMKLVGNAIMVAYDTDTGDLVTVPMDAVHKTLGKNIAPYTSTPPHVDQYNMY
jgi:hypothetical protein